MPLRELIVEYKVVSEDTLEPHIIEVLNSDVPKITLSFWVLSLPQFKRVCQLIEERAIEHSSVKINLKDIGRLLYYDEFVELYSKHGHPEMDEYFEYGRPPQMMVNFMKLPLKTKMLSLQRIMSCTKAPSEGVDTTTTTLIMDFLALGFNREWVNQHFKALEKLEIRSEGWKME